MIFRTEQLECRLESGQELCLRGRGRIVWPNREGEGFSLDAVHPVLKRHGCLESGLSISWPATASSEAVLVEAPDGSGFILRAAPRSDGLHRELRIFSDGREEVRLKFSGIGSSWRQLPLPEVQAGSGALRSSPPRYQFQLGLTGPDGETEAAGGFGVLPPLAERFAGLLDRPGASNPVIHIFGYGAGHDRGYPDYTPAGRLGGPGVLRSAAEELHKQGFMLSCYLNARIAEEECLKEFPGLKPGLCRGSGGTPVVEVYNGRRFNVVSPSFEPWLDHLYEQAVMLKDCGADAVQLDQVSGRAPVVPPGSEWGAGYRRLIERLQAAGLRVWIQGVSDYYPADWFEMTHRELSILPGGILRGGNPFGDTDLRLTAALAAVDGGKAQPCYLAPLRKARQIDSCGLPLMIDVMNVGERLPLYGRDYLTLLDRLEETGLNL